jgi:hypothetical protein
MVLLAGRRTAPSARPPPAAYRYGISLALPGLLGRGELWRRRNWDTLSQPAAPITPARRKARSRARRSKAGRASRSSGIVVLGRIRAPWWGKPRLWARSIHAPRQRQRARGLANLGSVGLAGAPRSTTEGTRRRDTRRAPTRNDALMRRDAKRQAQPARRPC